MSMMSKFASKAASAFANLYQMNLYARFAFMFFLNRNRAQTVINYTVDIVSIRGYKLLSNALRVGRNIKLAKSFEDLPEYSKSKNSSAESMGATPSSCTSTLKSIFLRMNK
jgi:hypothetical protein